MNLSWQQPGSVVGVSILTIRATATRSMLEFKVQDGLTRLTDQREPAPGPLVGPSTPSRSHCRVQALQFHAGVSGGELPIGFDVLFVAAVLPGGDFLGQGLLVRDTSIETLTRQHAELGLGHVQPTAVFGRIVPFEPLDEAARLGGGESLVE